MTFFLELFTSIGCIIFTISLSQFVREYVRINYPKELWGLLCMEFMASFETVAVVYECSIIMDLGGLPIWTILLFGIWYWRTKNWKNVSGSPCTYLEAWVVEKIGLFTVVPVILIQLAGGFFAYQYYTKLYWSLGLSEAHTMRLSQMNLAGCTSDIRAPPLKAALVEGIGLFTYCLIARIVGRIKYLDGVSAVINAFMGTFLVLLALDSSGGYFNPVLASAVQYGCKGTTLLENFQVYWIADTFGVLGSYYADLALVNGFSKTKNKIIGSIMKSKSNKKSGDEVENLDQAQELEGQIPDKKMD